MTILQTIVEEKRREISRLPAEPASSAVLRAALQERGEARDFLAALRRAAPRQLVEPLEPGVSRSPQPPGDSSVDSVALIAEVKKASPSAGVICPDFDPVRIAREYQAAGATCLSVLTDEKFFQGSLDSLRRIREVVDLPLLRKDFIIDERQVVEAIRWGADAILLIVAILSDERLRHFLTIAATAGLAALVEVHDEAELERALHAGAELIGVNNRNLKTFQVDLGTTERLAACCVSASLPQASAPRRVPFLVAESGIHSRADVQRMARCGARAILVGESLMRHADLRAKVRELLGS